MAKMSNMSKARAKLLINHPFFASLVMSSPWIETRDIPTAATDSKNFYYNPDFMDSLSLEENMGVQAHEAMHDALMHIIRMGGRDQRIWNMACDYTINKIVLDCGLKLPEGCLIDAELGKNSADINYDILMKKSQENKKRGKQGQQGNQGNPGQPNPSSGNQPQDSQGQNGGGDGLKEDVLGRDMKEPANSGDPAEQIKREQEVRQRVAQAANIARMAGKMPGSLARFIDQILNPQVAWQEVLREYMTRFTKNDESWAKRNRRFADIYLPTRYSEQMGEVIIIPDTSGSMGKEEMNFAGSEIMGIVDECKPERVRVMWSDTEVANEQVFEHGDDLVFEPKGGGGTDMRVPLAKAVEYEPEVVILITDGYTPWPQTEPDYPLIVVCTTNVAVPIGQVIRTK